MQCNEVCQIIGMDIEQLVYLLPLAVLSTTNNAMQWLLQNPDKGHVVVGQIGRGGETEEEGEKMAKIFIFLGW